MTGTAASDPAGGQAVRAAGRPLREAGLAAADRAGDRSDGPSARPVPADRRAAADRLAGRRLYLCTADRPDLASFLIACIGGGVDVVQLRDKALDARALLERAAIALEVCRMHDVPFILNDRPDLALACGADGVHVGQNDAPPWLARRILGPDTIVGRSTHAVAELMAAAAEPVDYVSAGPVNSTPTKPGRPGTGLGYLSVAAVQATVPWFVTGGVSPESVGAMIAAGARRFVVVRYLTEATHPRANAERLARIIDGSGVDS